MRAHFAPFAVASLLALAPMACIASPEAAPFEESSEAVTAGSGTPVYATTASDEATSVSVHNGMTLTMHADLTWAKATGTAPNNLVLRGSTSQNLSFVQGFIPDDSFGTATQLGPRSFELVFDNPSDIDTVVSGVPFFLELTAGAGTEYVAEIDIAPRLILSGTTTTRLALGSAITPVYVSDNPDGIHFRGTATTTSAPKSLTVSAAVDPTLTKDAAHAWHFDWLYGDFVTAAASTDLVVAKATFGASTSTREGTIEVRVSKIALAVGASADDTYGFPTCDPVVQACISALPPGTVDYGSCGPFFPVSVCLND